MSHAPFVPFTPQRAVVVGSVYTVHYVEYTRSYAHAGYEQDS